MSFEFQNIGMKIILLLSIEFYFGVIFKFEISEERTNRQKHLYNIRHCDTK